MKKSISILILWLATTVFAANFNSPIGYWQQYDDHGGALQSIIKIYQGPENTLAGKVVTGFAIDGKAPNLYCTACSGKLRNRRIAGMKIMWGMKFKQGYWQDGHIIDPNTGGEYHAEMRLFDGGKKLSVRGYIGISLFGRSQTWIRLPQSKLPAMMKIAYPQPKKLYLK